MNDEEIYYISNLEELDNFLQGKYSGKTEEKIPLFFIKSNDGYFLYDESVPYFKKAPEISSVSFLANVKLLMAIHNRYIPIFSKETKGLLFTEDEFWVLRKKMSGLKKYNCGDFIFADDLSFPGIDELMVEIEQNNKKVDSLKTVVEADMRSLFKQIGIDLSFDHHKGIVKLLDTGSTSRGTSVPSPTGEVGGDFDFLLRAPGGDIERIKDFLINKLGRQCPNKLISRHRIRLFGVQLEGLDKPIDIDVSFVRSDKDYYATEEALSDRLEQIKMQDEMKYLLVQANIVMAKKVLKEAGVYKPSRSDKSQAGLGGIGIENWILQYGGSFKAAALDFLAHAKGKDFIEFEKEYSIFDFGNNHISIARHRFPYDNFVIKNMRQNGYLLMQQALLKYINSLPKEETLKF